MFPEERKRQLGIVVELHAVKRRRHVRAHAVFGDPGEVRSEEERAALVAVLLCVGDRRIPLERVALYLNVDRQALERRCLLGGHGEVDSEQSLIAAPPVAREIEQVEVISQIRFSRPLLGFRR